MRIQLLPSTVAVEGRRTLNQHLTSYLIDDCVAVDAGSIAIALSEDQSLRVQDIIVTHCHMDHIASLPIFIDNLFSILKEPIRIHATQEVIDALERDVFNWSLYPRFSELTNEHGAVMEYHPIRLTEEFKVAHLRVTAIRTNHIVPTAALIVSDTNSTVGFSSDTAETHEFWDALNQLPQLDAVLVEASFPNSMARLAEASRHLTPLTLSAELSKLKHDDVDILAVHLKPTYRETVIEELNALGISTLSVMEPGRTYTWSGREQDCLQSSVGS